MALSEFDVCLRASRCPVFRNDVCLLSPLLRRQLTIELQYSVSSKLRIARWSSSWFLSDDPRRGSTLIEKLINHCCFNSVLFYTCAWTVSQNPPSTRLSSCDSVNQETVRVIFQVQPGPTSRINLVLLVGPRRPWKIHRGSTSGAMMSHNVLRRVGRSWSLRDASPSR